jgi:hypothetical protein
MTRELNTLPVPRNRIFVTLDGMFVVQWELNRVQDLLTGKYHIFSSERYGTPIADWELNQLRSKGIVYSYDDELVHLASMPDAVPAAPIQRSFYLNTSLEKKHIQLIERTLRDLSLEGRFAVRVREQHLAIRGANGVAFPNFEEAEKAREFLAQHLPEYFSDTAVAFVELTNADE